MASTSSTDGGLKPVSVVFVCLGNICRSPMAEAVFQHLTKPSQSPLSPPSPHPLIANIDSAGTAAYHTGSSPDSRTMSTLASNGIKTYRHSARQITSQDLLDFDYLFAMDSENLRNLERLRAKAVKAGKGGEEGKGLAKVLLWGDFGGNKGEEVDDPYYGGNDGFETAYEQMVRFSKGFLSYLEKERAGSKLS